MRSEFQHADIGRYSVGYIDHNGRPCVDFYSSPEEGDECIAIYPVGRRAWHLAGRIARTLERFGVCRITCSDGRLVEINPGGYQAFDLEVV